LFAYYESSSSQQKKGNKKNKKTEHLFNFPASASFLLLRPSPIKREAELLLSPEKRNRLPRCVLCQKFQVDQRDGWWLER